MKRENEKIIVCPVQRQCVITPMLLGGGFAHEMSLFTLPRFAKVFLLSRVEAFFKFASLEHSVDGTAVSFSRNGI